MESKHDSLAAYRGLTLLPAQGDRETAGVSALVIDLDDSFYHPHKPEATWQLYKLCVQKGWAVIVVTGNAFAGVLPRILSRQIPPPHIVIGSVGTEIWVLHSKQPLESAYQQDDAFTKFINAKQYNRHEIVKKSLALIEELADTAPDYKLDFQHPERERAFLEHNTSSPEPYKVSFYCFASTLQQIKQLEDTLVQYFPSWTISISDHTSYNREHAGQPAKAYCVDILPIGKAGAVQYLTDLLHITQGIIAGDSGNDIDMLLTTSPDLISVLVAGAKEEAKAAFPYDRSMQLKEWRVTLLDMPSGRKVWCMDTSPTRLGPESVIAALDMLPRFQELKG